MIVQTPLQRKAKASADIVFCIDSSGSMSPCIEGVKNHIESFITGLISNPQFDLDWRLGIVSYDYEVFRILEFTEDIERFRSALQKIEAGGDELTFPALDWSLDFPWRPHAHKIIVLFTDEPLEDGDDPDYQRSKMDLLFEKIVKLRCMVYFVGPSCEEYEKIATLPRCYFEPLEQHEDFFKIGFDKVLERIGKTISQSISYQGQSTSEYVPKDIYGIKGRLRIEKL